MYGLSANYNVLEFVKKELEQVCFSANTICLSFDEDISVTIMGSFIHSCDNSDKTEKQSAPVLYSDLMSLIGCKVKLAERGDDGSLVLRFDNGHILTILDDSLEYESYSICIGKKEIFV